MLLLSRMFLGSLFHRVVPAQANARRPKRSRLTMGTSSSNPPAERSERGGVWRRSSAARNSGVPLYMALCTSTSSLKSIRFLTSSQCNCRSIVVMDCSVTPHHGILMWGNRVIVPTKLRGRVMETLHEGHMGIVKMKGLARGHVWWPRMDEDIEDVTKRCEGCPCVANNPKQAPLHRWEYPA